MGKPPVLIPPDRLNAGTIRGRQLRECVRSVSQDQSQGPGVAGSARLLELLLFQCDGVTESLLRRAPLALGTLQSRPCHRSIGIRIATGSLQDLIGVLQLALGFGQLAKAQIRESSDDARLGASLKAVRGGRIQKRCRTGGVLQALAWVSNL